MKSLKEISLPITEAEANKILNRLKETEDSPRPKTMFEVGEHVRAIEGAFKDFVGTVEKVDYENKKVIPLSFENSFQGVYEEYDISDGKPETMKLINDILAFADDWMDEIEVQGYSPVTGDEEIRQTKDNISR